MKINETTMLYEEISTEAREEMLVWAKAVVLTGKVPTPDPSWVTTWMDKFDYSTPQRYLLVSTTLPQRVMLSLLLDCQETR